MMVFPPRFLTNQSLMQSQSVNACVQVMARLWKVELEHACKLISLLGDAGVVRHATLESGAMWCVPTRTFAAALRHVFREESAIMHAAVLAVYEDMPTFSSWESVKDDGFIVLQLMRHLAVTRRLDDIRCVPETSSCIPPNGVSSACCA